MSRSLSKLSDVTAKTLKKAGRHSDGGGLYLNVTPSGAKSWLFMWTRGGRRREMGLGSYPAISLASAREKAREHRTTVAEGRDPLAEKAKGAAKTFGDCVGLLLESIEGQWRNARHRAQWRDTLTDGCATIFDKPVADITTADVLGVLKPMWSTQYVTASRLRGRIERVLDFAEVHNWRSEGKNPAAWRGHLRLLLPARPKLDQSHHAAMPYADVPALIARLGDTDAMPAKALEFLILTAARSGEVREATWREIDLGGKRWSVPRERMKAGIAHIVPLSDHVIQLLTTLAEVRVNDFVFPGHARGRPLSGTAMAMLLRRLGYGHFTIHGFRSAFRDWAGDETHFPREVAEAALAHKVGDAVERAYRRGSALEKRRQLMQAWSDYCSNLKVANVVQFNR